MCRSRAEWTHTSAIEKNISLSGVSIITIHIRPQNDVVVISEDELIRHGCHQALDLFLVAEVLATITDPALSLKIAAASRT